MAFLLSLIAPKAYVFEGTNGRDSLRSCERSLQKLTVSAKEEAMSGYGHEAFLYMMVQGDVKKQESGSYILGTQHLKWQPRVVGYRIVGNLHP